LLVLSPLAAQPPQSQAGKEAPPRVEFKGEARVNAHSYKMEKGTTYRLTVKGKGFLPEAYIQDPGRVTTANPTGLAMTAPVLAGGDRNVAQMLYTAPETRVYQIKVDRAPGNVIEQGPQAYTLTIERAVFKPQLAATSPQLDIAEQTRNLEQGKLYSITVTGRGFAPEVQVQAGSRTLATAFQGRWYGFGPDAEFVTSMTFTPPTTRDYRILVGVGPFVLEHAGPWRYLTQISELKVAFSFREQLTRLDPLHALRNGPYKRHSINLEAGKTYQMDMSSTVLDSYLFLEDARGQVLQQDDDSGGGLNARLIFRPARTDTYQLVATTFKEGVYGPYTLTVVENPQVQPRFDAPTSLSTPK
jgi:hypothetical protein